MRRVAVLAAALSVSACADSSAEVFSASECEISEDQLWLELDPLRGNPGGRRELDLDSSGVTFRNHSPYFAKLPEMLAGSYLAPGEIVLTYTEGKVAYVERIELPTESCKEVVEKARPLIPWLGDQPVRK
jgi:hypothetical protein